MRDKQMLHAKYSEEELLANRPADQGIPTTCAVLSYEIGDLIKCAMNIHWGGVRGYQGESKVAMGDTVTMLRLLCVLLNLDLWECLREGEERYMGGETIRETRRDGVASPE